MFIKHGKIDFKKSKFTNTGREWIVYHLMQGMNFCQRKENICLEKHASTHFAIWEWSLIMSLWEWALKER